MGSRLEYYILFRSKFKQRLMLEKESNIQIAQKSDFFSLSLFCFRCLSSFGIIDYLYERLSLDMNMGYRIALEFFSSLFFYKRNTYYKR
jgi:hypothetical protein